MMRYPGGKLRLQKKIDPLIVETYPESKNAEWIVGEPFTGGGGSLINMGKDFPNWKFRINDFNTDISIFWKFMAFAPDSDIDKFCSLIKETKVDLNKYKEIFNWKTNKEIFNWESSKEIYNNEFNKDIYIAFRIFFLNKTSFGGYVTQCSPIGGQEQKSKWGVDIYWNHTNLIKHVTNFRKLFKCSDKERIQDECRVLSVDSIDCDEFIKKYKFNFVYADPPYISYGKTWYDCDFGIEQLEMFRNTLVSSKSKWCISMDKLKETKKLFENDVKKYVDIKHGAKSAYKQIKNKAPKIRSVKELVVFNRG